jgi:hypothetical protein
LGWWFATPTKSETAKSPETANPEAAAKPTETAAAKPTETAAAKPTETAAAKPPAETQSGGRGRQRQQRRRIK